MTFPRRADGSQSGFSLIELMIALFLMSIVIAIAVQQIADVEQRSSAEQTKVDTLQEGREFMDQIVRDLHETGYPSIRQFDTSSFSSPALASPAYNDQRLATGIIKLAPNELQLEGDVDGSGRVSTVDYLYSSSGNGCPCLQRSQVLKSVGGTNFSTAVQGVQNAATTADPIFVAYESNGTLVNSADLSSSANQQLLANLKTVQVTLKLKSPILDSKTKQFPETSLASTVTLVNCSLAANGQAMSCQ